ncbi:GumC family protein [candidate division KSB1 bacterium]|nr:GumC family protein [candidate division KSB1 bacterium]
MVHHIMNYEEKEAPVSLLHIVTIVFKHKWIVLSFFFGIVGIVTLGSLRTTKIYEARSKFIVEKEGESEKALLLQVNVPSQYEKYDWINAEIEILKSRPVAMRVVKELGFDQNAHPVEQLAPNDSDIILERSVKSFQKGMQVEVAKNSNVIEISYKDQDPVMATNVVNSVINAYVEYRSELYDESETYKFFEEQMEITDRKLQDLERDQSDFKRKQNMFSPEAQREILLTRLADYEKKLTDVRTERRRKAAILNVIKGQLGEGDGQTTPAIESNDSPVKSMHVTKLRGELLDLELKREIALQKFTPEYQEVINLDRQIAATKAKLASEVGKLLEIEEITILSLSAEENVLRQSIENTSNEMNELAQKEYEYSQISRGLEDNREIYSMLLKQREAAGISRAKHQKGVSVKVISPAVVPDFPLNPQTKLKIAIAAVLGVICGLGLAFLREYFDHTFTFPEEIERYIGLVVLGSVREFNERIIHMPITDRTRRELVQNSQVDALPDLWIT